MGCLVGLFRLLGMLVWQAVLTTALALVLSRADEWFEGRGGRASDAWKLYRRSQRRKKPR